MAEPNLPQEQLSKKNLAAIQNYLVKIKEKWIDLGVQLNLDPDYLDDLSKNQSSSDGDKLRQLLLTWLKGEKGGEVPTWKELCRALRTPSLDEAAIAEVIECNEIMTTETTFTESTNGPESEEIVVSDRSSEVNQSSEESKNEPMNIAIREPFPLLSTSGLSIKEKDSLLEKLMMESMEIRLKFASLVSSITISFLSRDIDVSELTNELKSFGSLISESVSSIGSVGEAMGMLNECWDFNEYSLLEHLILKFGTSEDHESMEDYKENLGEFSRRRLFECPEGIFGNSENESEETVIMKRLEKGVTPYDVKLKDVQEISSSFRKQMGIRDCDLRLRGVGREDQSLVLTFSVTSSIAAMIFPLLQDKKEMLFSKGIWHVTCGEHVFQQENRNDEDIDGAELDEENETREVVLEKSEDILQSTTEPAILKIQSTMNYEDDDIGNHTSICINNKNIVVEVSNSSSSLYKSYKVGKCKRGVLEWLSGSTGIRYGMGKAPKIALTNKGYVVEVDEESDGVISYRVGMVHVSNVMLWTESTKLTSGSKPSLCLCYKTVVLAFQRGSEAFYRIGTLDYESKSISWSSQEHRFLVGVSDLAIAGNIDSTVAVVYMKPLVTAMISPLYTTVGALQKQEQRILFSSVKTLSQSFSVGFSPSVGLNCHKDIVVLSTHQKSMIQKKIKCKIGLIKQLAKTNSFIVKWSTGEDMFNLGGEKAAVAMNDKGIVLISYTEKGQYFSHVAVFSPHEQTD